MSKDFETYFEQNATDGALPDDAMAKLLVGDMGDTATADAVEVPATAPEEEQAKEMTSEQTPAGDGKQADDAIGGDGGKVVILAKDGVNTISYDKLVEAREKAKMATEEAQNLRQETENLKREIEAMNASIGQAQSQTKPEPEPEPAAQVDIVQLEREWHEAMLDDNADKAIEIRGKINGEIARRTREEITVELMAEQSAKDQQVATATAQQLLDKAAAETVKQYPELDTSDGAGDAKKVAEIVEYRDFLIASKGMQPHEALQKAAKRIMGEPKAQDEPVVGDTAAPKVVPPVKERTPTTMSDIPGGTAPHHDEAEAMMQMSNSALLGKMMGMSPDKIMETLSRVV